MKTMFRTLKSGHVTLMGLVIAVTMLAANGPAVAGSPKGACQAGGVNTAVLDKAQLQYWQWYFGIVWKAPSWCSAWKARRARWA